MSGHVHLRFEVGHEMRRVADALRREDKAFPSQLRKKITQVSRPLVQLVRANVRALPSSSSGSTGLRKQVAAGVGMRIGTGKKARVRIITRMPRDKRRIPKGLDTSRWGAGWEHPVFGDPDIKWVKQYGGPWFVEPLISKRNDVARDVMEVLRDALDRIDKAGGL